MLPCRADILALTLPGTTPHGTGSSSGATSDTERRRHIQINAPGQLQFRPANQPSFQPVSHREGKTVSQKKQEKHRTPRYGEKNIAIKIATLGWAAVPTPGIEEKGTPLTLTLTITSLFRGCLGLLGAVLAAAERYGAREET
ncbi:hypothetical protein E2C01_008204 [Portunus trituberculatus]|uniref:Uncharacterized protein n=1 Tax=Portunus trituberculatus TaxID=210409 RepID=A0A5B7D588_PORTR|nr:hypothetical protein [Portunus trituberculatus]